MQIQRAFKVELRPNNKQRSAFAQHAGAARWAYNWGLAKRIESFKETGKSPNAMELHKELVVLKKTPLEDGGVPWMSEISKWVPQEALRNLDVAFKNFFRKCKQKKSGKKGHPKFKSRHKNPLKFKLYQGIRTDENSKKIKLPKIGWVRLKESGYLPVESDELKIQSASISEKAGRWFVSLGCLQTIPDPPQRQKAKVVGVDVGTKSLAVTSDGLVFENPKAFKQVSYRLKLAQRNLARKKKGSANRLKAKKRLQKVFFRIVCIRKDALQKATTAIVRSADVICIESLSVESMLKNRKVSRSVSDASMAEFLRQVEYKCAWSGVQLVKADRFFPSSKTCSDCGWIFQEQTLNDRSWICKGCGSEHDRDLNAAINLRNLALQSLKQETAVGSTVAVCGEEIRPGNRFLASSVKQELNNPKGDKF